MSSRPTRNGAKSQRDRKIAASKLRSIARIKFPAKLTTLRLCWMGHKSIQHTGALYRAGALFRRSLPLLLGFNGVRTDGPKTFTVEEPKTIVIAISAS